MKNTSGKYRILAIFMAGTICLSAVLPDIWAQMPDASKAAAGNTARYTFTEEEADRSVQAVSRNAGADSALKGSVNGPDAESISENPEDDGEGSLVIEEDSDEEQAEDSGRDDAEDFGGDGAEASGIDGVEDSGIDGAEASGRDDAEESGYAAEIGEGNEDSNGAFEDKVPSEGAAVGGTEKGSVEENNDGSVEETMPEEGTDGQQGGSGTDRGDLPEEQTQDGKDDGSESGTAEETEGVAGGETEEGTEERTEEDTEENTEGETEEGTEGETGGEIEEGTEGTTGGEAQGETEEGTEGGTQERTEGEAEEGTEGGIQEGTEGEPSAETRTEDKPGTEDPAAGSTVITEGESEDVSEEGSDLSGPEYPAQILTADAGEIVISAEAPEGAFPEDTQMQVSAVEKKSTFSDIEEAVAADFTEVRKIYAADICFLRDGQEIEPLVPVKIIMSVKDADGEAQMTVVRVDDDGTVEIVPGRTGELIYEASGSAASDEQAGGQPEDRLSESGQQDDGQAEERAGGLKEEQASEPGQTDNGPDEDQQSEDMRDISKVKGASAVFEADRSCVYALVETRTIEKLYLGAEGDSWKITVGYSADTGISGKAALQVRELVGEENDRLQETVKLFPESREIVSARFFDIRIIDQGGEIIPLAPVEVRVNTEKQEGEACLVRFGEGGPEIVDAQIAEKEGENETEVVFSTLSFPEYGIVFTKETEKEEPVYPAQSFTASAGGITVTAEAPEGAFPEGTKIQVKAVKKKSTLSDIEEAASGDFVEVQKIYAVDISFWKDDQEIEPLVPISVSMSAKGVDKEAQSVVVHVDDDGKAEVIAEGTEAEIPGISDSGEDSEGGEAAASFETDQFSVYALVLTQTIEKLYIDAEGTTWKITVGYGADAGISADATLDVREITDADDYLARAEELIPEGRHISRARFFDISILEGGQPVQPKAPVNVCVALADAPEDGKVQAVHFGEDGGELIDAERGEEGVTFDAVSFSTYGIVFSQGIYEWSMMGGTNIWLSTLLEKLKADFGITDVANIISSDDSKIKVTPKTNDNTNDWLVASTGEIAENGPVTLTVTQTDGSSTKVAITIKPAPEPCDLESYLTRIEFMELNGTYLGGSDDPNPIPVRFGDHHYNLKLSFKEEGQRQFPDDGIMYFTLPEDTVIKMDVLDGYEKTFSISLGRKDVLEGNRVIYHKTGGGPNGDKPCMEIQWNTADKRNMNLLKASAIAEFSIILDITIPTMPANQGIQFSQNIWIDLVEDPDYSVDVKKTGNFNDLDDKSILTYAVDVTATEGKASNMTLTDVMGEALTFMNTPGQTLVKNITDPSVSRSGNEVTVTYKDKDGNPVTTVQNDQNEDVPVYPDDNIEIVSQETNQLTLKVKELKEGHTATINYDARVNYVKLGGKDNAETTSNNTVTATKESGDVLDEDSYHLEVDKIYLQMAKEASEVSYYDSEGNLLTDDSATADVDERQGWAYQSIKWTLAYNTDQYIDVEGATLYDEIWDGAREQAVYDTQQPFTIYAYDGGIGTINEKNGHYTPPANANGIEILNIPGGWGSDHGITVTDYNNNLNLSIIST